MALTFKIPEGLVVDEEVGDVYETIATFKLKDEDTLELKEIEGLAIVARGNKEVDKEVKEVKKQANSFASAVTRQMGVGE